MIEVGVVFGSVPLSDAKCAERMVALAVIVQMWIRQLTKLRWRGIFDGHQEWTNHG